MVILQAKLDHSTAKMENEKKVNELELNIKKLEDQVVCYLHFEHLYLMDAVDSFIGFFFQASTEKDIKLKEEEKVETSRRHESEVRTLSSNLGSLRVDNETLKRKLKEVEREFTDQKQKTSG